MNGRDLYGAIYSGAEVDELPAAGIGWWGEALERWRREGLGPGQDPNEAIGFATDQTAWLPVNLNMAPSYPVEVLELDAEYATVRDEYGVTRKMLRTDYDRSKGLMGASGDMSSMSLWLDFPVTDVRSWKSVLEERFLPTPRHRLPSDWPAGRQDLIDYTQTRWTWHFSFPFGGLFSAVRQLMGLEAAAAAMMNNPVLVQTIANDLADFYLSSFALILKLFIRKH